MSDPRKPLFPDDDDLPPDEDDLEDESLDEDMESEPVPPPEPVHTPAAERFPPLDPASYGDSQEPAPPEAAPKRSHRLHNLLTILFSLGTILLLAYFALLWTIPSSPLNPLPPFTPVPQFITTTPLPPTSTPIPSLTPTVPTATFTVLPASALTPLPSFSPAAFPFTLSEDGVEYRASEDGCDGSSIAGTVTDLSGAAVADYAVRIRDQEGPLNATIPTGDAPAMGPGGFALQVSDTLKLAPYIVQLLDADGAPVSEEYLVVSSDQCDQNVAVVNFVQNR